MYKNKMHCPQILVVGTLFLCSVCHVLGHDIAQNANAIPGRSLGKIRLGMSRLQVHSLLGKPSDDTYGGPRDYYFSSSSPQRNEVYFNYNHGRVVSITFNAPSFKTKDGISINSSLDQIQAHHRNLRNAVYLVQESFVYVYDDEKLGIAFLFQKGAIEVDDGKQMVPAPLKGNDKPILIAIHRPHEHYVPLLSSY